MKKRFYKKNVIEGGIRFDKAIVNVKRDLPIDILKSVILFAVCIAADVIAAHLLIKYASFPRSAAVGIFIPLSVDVMIKPVYDIVTDLYILRCCKLDKSGYSGFMKLREKIIKSKTSAADIERALRLYEKYRCSYKENHELLVSVLKDLLKEKPASPVTVGVVSGLLCMCNAESDSELLFDARYGHGPAGSFVFPAWADRNGNYDLSGFQSYWNSLLNIRIL